MTILDLIRPELKSIQKYKTQGDNLSCRLHANELPASPMPMPNFNLNYYPDIGKQTRLQEKLAEHYQVEPNQLILTRGSSEGIDIVMRLFLRPGIDSILQCPPTFPLYSFYACLQNATVLNCPLDEQDGFSLSLEKLFSTWQKDCKIIFLCQPNNPSGNLLDLDVIARVCERFVNKAIVVVDEAYIEFAKAESATSLLEQFNNLLILRTLSKAYGLASLRLGCILSSSEIVNALQSIMAPYLIASPVIDLADRALKDKPWFTRTIQKIIDERLQLTTALKQSPLIKHVYPSHANFVLVKSPHAHSLFHWFARHGIAVRGFANDPILGDMFRITVGDTPSIKKLISILSLFEKQEELYEKNTIY